MSNQLTNANNNNNDSNIKQYDNDNSIQNSESFHSEREVLCSPYSLSINQNETIKKVDDSDDDIHTESEAGEEDTIDDDGGGINRTDGTDERTDSPTSLKEEHDEHSNNGRNTERTPLKEDDDDTTTIALKKDNIDRTKKKPLFSSIKSDKNPLTIKREKNIKDGKPLVVTFADKIIVHTVPYWDPMGENYYDYENENGPHGPQCYGPQCCVIL